MSGTLKRCIHAGGEAALPQKVRLTLDRLRRLTPVQRAACRRKLARLCHVSRSTLYAHLRVLASAGLIAVERRGSGPGSNAPINVLAVPTALNESENGSENGSDSDLFSSPPLPPLIKIKEQKEGREPSLRSGSRPARPSAPAGASRSGAGRSTSVASVSGPDEQAAAGRWFRLADGRSLTPFALRQETAKLGQRDMERLLDGRASICKAMRPVFLRGLADILYTLYVRRRAEVYGANPSHWVATDRSRAAFSRAAETWAREYISRGMSMETFLDAAAEMAPKTLRYPTPDYLGGPYLAENIYAWIPEAERGPVEKVPVVTLEDTLARPGQVMSDLKRPMFRGLWHRNWPGLWDKRPDDDGESR